MQSIIKSFDDLGSSFVTLFCGSLRICWIVYRAPDQISLHFEVSKYFSCFAVGYACYCDQCPPSPSHSQLFYGNQICNSAKGKNDPSLVCEIFFWEQWVSILAHWSVCFGCPEAFAQWLWCVLLRWVLPYYLSTVMFSYSAGLPRMYFKVWLLGGMCS